MTTTTDDLRRALAERAAATPVPDVPPVAAIRQRVLLGRLRGLTAVAAAVLLVVGITAVVRDRTSVPTTVDSRLAGRPDPTATTAGPPATTSPPVTAAPRSPSETATGGTPVAPRSAAATTTVVPRTVGPIQLGSSPPTTRAAGEPTFAVAQPGTWWYRIVAERSDHTKPVIGPDDGYDSWPDASFDVRPAEGRTQRTNVNQLPWVTVRAAIRTLADAVTIHQETLWDGNDDTERTFSLPRGAYEVPATADWDRPWAYAATSTDGKTHLRVQSKVGDPRDIVHLADGAETSFEAIRVDSVLEVSGDRTSRIERSVWWAKDLGVPAQIREVERTTTSSGTTYWRNVTVTLGQTTPSGEPLNRQVVDAAQP